MTEPASTCIRCANPLPPDALACPHCGQLVHVDRLNSIAAQATLIEPQNPQTAASIWQKCLPLLPAHSPHFAAVQARHNDLSTGHTVAADLRGAPASSSSTPAQRFPRQSPPLDFRLDGREHSRLFLELRPPLRHRLRPPHPHPRARPRRRQHVLRHESQPADLHSLPRRRHQPPPKPPQRKSRSHRRHRRPGLRAQQDQSSADSSPSTSPPAVAPTNCSSNSPSSAAS